MKTGESEVPEVVEKVDQAQIQQFVTTIKSAEQQVGEHIINALRHDGTVAVLTTVIIGGDGQQHVVSAGLSPPLLEQVQKLLMKAEQERQKEEPCVGFHCFLKPREDVPGMPDVPLPPMNEGEEPAEDEAPAQAATAEDESEAADS